MTLNFHLGLIRSQVIQDVQYLRLRMNYPAASSGVSKSQIDGAAECAIVHISQAPVLALSHIV